MIFLLFRIFIISVERLPDLFVKGLRDFFVVEMLRDFLCGEVALFFVWRGCVIFVCDEVA